LRDNDFGRKLEAARRSVKTINNKPLSQEAAARMFCASLAAYRSWEKGRRLPIQVYRDKIVEKWPQVFS
jgi:DNA-binding transcriptional regulator YiaG